MTREDLAKALEGWTSILIQLLKELATAEKEMRKMAILMNLKDIHIENLTKKLKSNKKKHAKN